MPFLDVNGKRIYYNISPYPARQTHSYYKNKIINAFEKIGIKSPYLDILWGGGNATWSTDGWAEVLWHVNGKDYRYKCTSQGKAVENLAAISQIIEADCKAIRRGLKSFGAVMNQFAIEDQTGQKTYKNPKEVIGVSWDCKDWDYIKFKYRQKAKELHPDGGGNIESFKELQEAFTKLKKEFGEE